MDDIIKKKVGRYWYTDSSSEHESDLIKIKMKLGVKD